MALQGVQLALGASDIAWLREMYLFNVLVEREGKFVDLTQTKQSLGVIARQWGDASCQRAVKAGKPALSLYWLWDCLWLNSPQPSLADKLYMPLPAGGIAGAAECKVTVSGIQGALRLVVLDLLQGVGVTVQKDMHLPTITHIIAKKVDDKSQKLVQARRPEFCGHISIVNVIWLFDSIRQRSIQPVEAYLCNVPPQNDPCLGAPASSARMPGVLVEDPAETPQVPDSPEQAEPQELQVRATEAGAAQVSSTAGGPAPAAQAPPPGSGASEIPTWMSRPAAPPSAQPYKTPASPRWVPPHQQPLQVSGPSHPQPVATAAPNILPALPDEDGVEDADAESDGTELMTGDDSDVDVDVDPGAPVSAELPGPPIPSASTGPGSTHASTQDSQRGPEAAGMTPHSHAAVPQLEAPSYIPLDAAPQPSPPSRPQAIGLRRARSTGAAAGTQAASAADQPPAKRSRRSAPGISIALAPTPRVSAQLDEPGGPADAGQTADEGQVPDQSGPVDGPGGAAGAKRPRVLRGSSAARSKQTSRRSSGGPAAADAAEELAAAAEAAEAPQKRRRSSRGQAAADSGAAGCEEYAEADLQGSSRAQKQRQPCRRRGKENVKAAAAREAGDAPANAKSSRSKQAKAATPAQKGRGKAARGPVPATPGPGKASRRRSRHRTPATAGPCKTPGSRADGQCRTVVSLSKMHTDERKQCLAILRSLQLPVSTAALWEPSVTHIVAPCLGRNARILAALAAGLWIASWDLLDVSQRSRCLVEPEPFELLEDPTGAMAPGVARHWRLRAEQTGCGAFQDLQVVLLPDCTGAGVHPTRNELAAMVGAGGGQAVPLTQAAQPGAVHLAIVGPQAAASDASIQQLLQAQVPCAAPQLLIQWLSQPEEELTCHLRFDSKIAGLLAEAAQARSKI